MKNIQSRQLCVLEIALLEFFKLVAADGSAGSVCAPVVVARKSSDRETFFGDSLPKFPLSLVAQRKSTIRNG